MPSFTEVAYEKTQKEKTTKARQAGAICDGSAYERKCGSNTDPYPETVLVVKEEEGECFPRFFAFRQKCKLKAPD